MFCFNPLATPIATETEVRVKVKKVVLFEGTEPSIKPNSLNYYNTPLKVKVVSPETTVSGKDLYRLYIWASSKEDGSGHRVGSIFQVGCKLKFQIKLNFTRLKSFHFFRLSMWQCNMCR